MDETPRLAHAFLCGVAVGLVLGTKASGIAIAFVIGGLLVAARRRGGDPWNRSRPRRRSRSSRPSSRRPSCVGGYWYSRNWIETGNPVWPLRVAPAGVELFSGPERVDEYLTLPPGGERFWLVEVARSWYHDLVFWTRGDYSYEERDGGLGPVWSWLGWGASRRPDLSRSPEPARRDRQPRRSHRADLRRASVSWWSRFTISLAGARRDCLGRSPHEHDSKGRFARRSSPLSSCWPLRARRARRGRSTQRDAGRSSRWSMSAALPQIESETARSVRCSFPSTAGSRRSQQMRPSSSRPKLRRFGSSIRCSEHPSIGTSSNSSRETRRRCETAFRVAAPCISPSSAEAPSTRGPSATVGMKRIFDERGVRVYERRSA